MKGKKMNKFIFFNHKVPLSIETLSLSFQSSRYYISSMDNFYISKDEFTSKELTIIHAGKTLFKVDTEHRLIKVFSESDDHCFCIATVYADHISDEKIPKLKELCRLIYEKEARVDGEVWPGGDCQYYVMKKGEIDHDEKALWRNLYQSWNRRTKTVDVDNSFNGDIDYLIKKLS